MTIATVKFLSLGHVEVKTDLNEIVLVGCTTINGDFVNCKTLKVYRNKRFAKEALRNSQGYYLKELKKGYFQLQEY